MGLRCVGRARSQLGTVLYLHRPPLPQLTKHSFFTHQPIICLLSDMPDGALRRAPAPNLAIRSSMQSALTLCCTFSLTQTSALLYVTD